MNCAACGVQVSPGARFCNNCGAEVTSQATGPQQGAAWTAKQADEIFCFSCGSAINREAEICVHCGVRVGRSPSSAGSKSKTTAILLAVFLGFFTWLYTYREDATKFWIGLGIALANIVLVMVTLGLWLLVSWLVGLGVWIWAIVDSASKSDEWYASY